MILVQCLVKVIQKYTLTLNFVKKRIIDIYKDTALHNPPNCDDQKNYKKKLHILKDGTSGVQVGDIKQMTV